MAGDRDHWHGCGAGAHGPAGSTAAAGTAQMVAKAAREAGFVNFLQKQGGLFCGSDYNNRRSFVQKA